MGTRRVSTVDKSYPGSGLLKCRICGEPYVDHKIEPCPMLGMDLLYTPEPIRHRQVRGRGVCAAIGCDTITQLKKRSKDKWMLYCSSACRKRASQSGQWR